MKPAPSRQVAERPDVESLLAAIVAELRGLRADVREVLGTVAASKSAVDGRHLRLLEALATAMGDDDLPFTSEEVLHHATIAEPLDQALKACGITSTGELGALLRELARRETGRWKLTRDGRDWRLCT